MSSKSETDSAGAKIHPQLMTQLSFPLDFATVDAVPEKPRAWAGKPTRYWIGVASREHVGMGVAGGFCQLCHGKAQPLRRMSVGDWIVYYSPKEIMGQTAPCQKFTAIGQVIGAEVYAFEMFPGFVPYRRDIQFVKAAEASIRPLLPQLSFIQDQSRWGYSFRFGHLEIPRADFELIATAMLGPVPKSSAAAN
jgi:hypothetical protein